MEDQDANKVAIVGAAGRFPGAADLREYWDLLLQGRVATADPDPSRTELWDVMRDPVLASRIATLKAGYLADIAGFDAEYFSISPREAVKLDPQQRLMLEVVHDALEDAALTREELQAFEVGVFVGAGTMDYITLDSRDKRRIDAYHGIGNSHCLLSNRISYYYNLKGPSFTVDTACSSSLYALHSALQFLQQGDIDLAIVGGVNVIASPDLTLAFSQAKMLSPSGRCHTFAARADGTGRAEGAAAVVLCRLGHARRHGHNVRAVIRGSALNQDGRSNGITAPNGQSQVRVVQAAMKRAGITPEDVAYIETHGTGTPLGDAIEFNALKRVFAGHPQARCLIGSVKANIGHAEAAAGICGLLKAMLILEHGVIPPHPVPGPYNDLINAPGSALHIAQTAEPLDPRRRCIGVSSFGFGGANAHVVVERYDGATPSPAPTGRPLLVVLSSHYPEGLTADARALAAYLAEAPVALDAVAHTLCHGRDHLRYRQAWVVQDREELRAALTAPFDIEEPLVDGSGEKRVAFVFTGQGSQYAGMGRALYERVQPFRAAFDHCAALIAERSGVAVADLLYGDAPGSAEALLKNTHLGQLSLFCFEYALAECWSAAGVVPDFVIGHSLGELVAHTVAGGIALPDAVALVDERARAMQDETHDGAMVAVFMDADTASRLLQELRLPLYLSAVNGKRAVTVSGAREAVEQLERHLGGRGVNFRRLATQHAFHSPFFERAAARLQQYAAGLQVHEPAVPIASNLDGRLVTTHTLEPAYWGEHILLPVQFAPGVATLIEQGARVFVEIGPDRTLASLIARDHGAAGVRAVHSAERGKDGERALLEAAGALYRLGVDVRFAAFAPSADRTRVSLPPRRLCRKRYWTGTEVAPARPADVPAARTERAADIVPAPAVAAELVYSEDADLPGVIDRQIRVMQAQLRLLETPEPAAHTV